MKAEDLMVGDWVLLFDDKIAKVDCIGNTEVFLSDETGLDWQVTYEHIKPIPLTPEILEKNGERDNDAIYSLGDGHEWLELTVCADGSVWWTINLDEYQITRLRYVHELQHALRLCGIVKEIIL